MGATIAQMRAVEALSRTGRFSLAAEELGVSQPTISAQVQAFEQASRRRIFLRQGHAVRLAPEAGALIAKIRVTLKCLAEVDAALEAGARLEHGSLHLGFSAHRLIMAPLTEFVRRYPGMRVRTQGGPSRALAAQVLSGELDLAAISMAEPDPRLACQPIASCGLVIYGPKHHPALRDGQITLDALARERLVLWNQDSATRGAIDQAAQRAGLSLDIALEVATLDVAYASVAAGLGLCCALEGEVTPDTFVDVAALTPRLAIDHQLVCLPECRDHAAITAFLDVARALRGIASGGMPGVEDS
ncbi:LysR family transcriptional regulator [Roseomonas sp. GC11]|uniref:LysR family transcriptional regulator n=1 Tax=Roseomonas sp. GC11 TaxID=2950546 RepID=UPI00210C0F96|nr:LysR family transcriptional regulator [Roseomonas sp. GC11]MCQ4161658.1 LysR family transcriptional regulator [Roseomonas sp. GC11]